MNRLGLLLALVALLAGCGGTRSNITAGTPPATLDASTTDPTGLSIPAIGVEVTGLDTFGLDNKGNYSCPVDPQSVAWNRGGTIPGEPGLALIVASATGPFRRLEELKPGDLVYITREGGDRLTFKTIGAGDSAKSPVVQLAGCGEKTVAARYAELVPS